MVLIRNPCQTSTPEGKILIRSPSQNGTPQGNVWIQWGLLAGLAFLKEFDDLKKKSLTDMHSERKKYDFKKECLPDKHTNLESSVEASGRGHSDDFNGSPWKTAIP